MLCMERGQRRRWVEIVVGNSECLPQTEAEMGTVRSLVHQLMDAKDVKMTDEMTKSLLELVTVESEDRIWAVIAVFYLLKHRQIRREMIDIVPVSLLLNPGYCGAIEQFCLVRLLLRALIVFREEVDINHIDVITRVAQVMRIVRERLLRCLLKDLCKLGSGDPEYLDAMFHLNVWNIIASCFNYARSGALVAPTRELKRLATSLLAQLLPDRAEQMRSELLAIKPEAIVWMLWTEDMWDYLPDVLDMLADEYPRLVETIDKEQRQAMIQRVRWFIESYDEATWALKMSSVNFLASYALHFLKIEGKSIRYGQCWRW